MFLITSAAYLDGEFSAELGTLPPTFLPVGNRPLLQHQLEQLHGYQDTIHVSLPLDFELNAAEQRLLADSNCSVIRVPLGISLGESILYCLNITANQRGPLRILHGDTLIYDLPLEREDLIVIGRVVDNYDWGDWPPPTAPRKSDVPAAGPAQIIAGYFAFSDSAEYIKQLVRAGNRFVESLEGYRQARSLDAVEASRWFDFGHLTTYHRSKAHVTTERAFNSLDVTRRIANKDSEHREKIRAEAAWFADVPGSMRIFCPQLLDVRDSGYALEYLHLSTLSELYVFGKLPRFVWERILRACREFLEAAREFKPERNAIDPAGLKGLYREKTLRRLEHFSEQTGFDLASPLSVNEFEPVSLRDALEDVSNILMDAADRDLCVVHGDFCFSNILYDFRTESIKVIDPRGLSMSNQPTIFGDRRYDLAKLFHSVVGRYDSIIADYFECSRNGNELSLEFPSSNAVEVETLLRSLLLEDDPQLELDVAALTVQLFLAMLPLHEDKPKRQEAFLANALRLYGQFVAKRKDCRVSEEKENANLYRH